MKICVISDSHGSEEELKNFFECYNFDLVFYLGDGLRDIEFYPNNIKKVAGNCDIFSFEPLVEVFSLLGHKFFLTHGHKFAVKTNPYLLLQKAKDRDCDIVCFGHTHRQFLEEIDGITLLNPGSFRNGDFATIEIDNSSKVKFTLDCHR